MLRFYEKAATIQILEVTTIPSLFEGVPEVLLYLWDLLKGVRDLEALHILDDPSQFMILVKVE